MFLSRRYLSITHLTAASLFASQCKTLESNAEQHAFCGEQVTQQQAYVVSSVILSAAFLEATINELFSDCADGHATRSLEVRDLMGRLWKQGVPKTASYSILEKYDIALELANRTGFIRGDQPYQDAKLLVQLRNQLVHFEPESVAGSFNPSEVLDLHVFEKRFRGKFEVNPLTGALNPFYPDKLLGAGCAIWSVKTAIAFADAFFCEAWHSTKLQARSG